MRVLDKSKYTSSRKEDATAVGIIFLYFLTHATVRLLISPTMERDESQQFIDAAVFQWGYGAQAPLYSWIVKVVSTIMGLNITTLITVKFCLIFLFYCVFYVISRSFWDSKKALFVTGSLMLFPLYLYEFNRDLSHTVLVTLMASITCLLYIRMLSRATMVYYILIGVSIGLGILSKYNFLFFALALGMASLSTREGRSIILDRRIALSLLSCLLIILPHLIWLLEMNFPSVHYAVQQAQSEASGSPSLARMFLTVVSPYLELPIFVIVFMLFFRGHLSPDSIRENPRLRFFRPAVLYGLIIPMLFILVLRASYFSERWLAPVYFMIPLAGFSMVNLRANDKRFRHFAFLCAFVAISALAIRVLIGFMPDMTGKAERIHIPFNILSSELKGMLTKHGHHTTKDLSVISNDAYLAANVMTSLPGMKFVPLDKVVEDETLRMDIYRHGGIILWDTSRRAGREAAARILKVFPLSVPLYLKMPYLHSKRLPPYIVGIAIISRHEF